MPSFLSFQICEDITNTTSDEETSSKRSVRFTEDSERGGCDGESEAHTEDGNCKQPVDYTSNTLKRHSSLFHNALRPNSALRQLFPCQAQLAATPLTHESLMAFEDAKKGSITNNSVHYSPETDTIRRTIERNALRRSLIKYEPK